jgi:hypothetical protein
MVVPLLAAIAFLLQKQIVKKGDDHITMKQNTKK